MRNCMASHVNAQKLMDVADCDSEIVPWLYVSHPLGRPGLVFLSFFSFSPLCFLAR